MRSALCLLVLLLGCRDRARTAETTEGSAASPAVVVTPDAARGAPRLAVAPDGMLCVDGACRQLHDDEQPKPATTEDEASLSFSFDGKPCTLRPGGAFLCDGKQLASGVELQWIEDGYLFAGDLLARFDEERELTKIEVPAVKQFVVAYRAACILTEAYEGPGEVWCWSSDPAKRKKIAMPPDVEQIALHDPFTLCARTTKGELHCAPPALPKGFLLCHREKPDTCRVKEIGDKKPRKAFAPIDWLARPVVKVELPFPIVHIARDEYRVQAVVPDLIEDETHDPRAGGCVLGSNGEVGCYQTCGDDGAKAATGWTTFVVEGAPPLAELRADRHAGVGLTASGELWWWKRDGCGGAGKVKAMRLQSAPAVQLTRLMHYEGMHKWGTFVRCASFKDGTVGCWSSVVDDGLPTKLLDPARGLPKPSR